LTHIPADMWLYPVMPAISALATRAYYRLTVSGSLPPSGPVLLVANHSNSLMDPALVVVAARRKVRFMAKHTLFEHKQIGWLIAAVGSVPVYRAMDEPKHVGRNYDSFRDVNSALASGDAVGIFPEGTSHSASRLQPLKTGAARIALGAALVHGGSFPIIPMGLVFRDRRSFRSPARVIIGEGCVWDDLAARGPQDKEAVRELTRRIERSMRAVTLNLRSWSDEQLVRCAERIWRAEFGASSDGRDELERLRIATDALALLRMGESDEWRSVARELRGHDRVLARLGLTPLSLRERLSTEDVASWLVRRLPLVPMIPLALAGFVLFRAPREITGAIAGRLALAEGEDAVPTFRVLYGAGIFLIWFAALAAGAAAWYGAGIGLAVFLALPFFAFLALGIADSQRLSWAEARRFVVLRTNRTRVEALRSRQAALADKLRTLFERRMPV
jgi:glycerol-3-phosphate O-acyltransferase/dihydroxyacetone phosphate acyltransferase